jgi:F-type H+-transporting ATPase subunit gamma
MANTRELRRRIKSIRNTAQITRAMQMVAASKMRRAQQLAEAGVPFSDLMNRILVELRDHVDPTTHPLLVERPVKKELVLLVSTDRGLCGSLNANLFKTVTKLDPATTEFVVVGRKGRQFLTRLKRDLKADFDVSDPAKFVESRRISKYVLERFNSGEVDRVRVLFPKFVNALIQKPQLETVLPISPVQLGKIQTVTKGSDKINSYGFLFEPGAHEVLDALLPTYVHYIIYQMVLEAKASEHSARMVAMKSATDNAKELIKDLRLEYNKVRQAAITAEIQEISTAALAMG